MHSLTRRRRCLLVSKADCKSALRQNETCCFPRLPDCGMSDIFIRYLLSFVVLFVVVKRRAWPTVSAVFARAESDWPRALSSVPEPGLCRGAAPQEPQRRDGHSAAKPQPSLLMRVGMTSMTKMEGGAWRMAVAEPRTLNLELTGRGSWSRRISCKRKHLLPQTTPLTLL
jgi:hypothetical protein